MAERAQGHIPLEHHTALCMQHESKKCIQAPSFDADAYESYCMLWVERAIMQHVIYVDLTISML